MFDVLQIVPILRIFDRARALEFYAGFLGFLVDWEHQTEDRPPSYLQVSRAGCVLHLSEHHGDGCPGATVFLRASGLEAYHRELMSRDYPYMRPGLDEAPWGGRLMEVTDPFGNRLRFHEAPS